jgi:hypothetical protein
LQGKLVRASLISLRSSFVCWRFHFFRRESLGREALSIPIKSVNPRRLEISLLQLFKIQQENFIGYKLGLDDLDPGKFQPF